MKKRDLDYVLCALLYSMWKQHSNRWGGFRFFLNSFFTHVMLLFGMNKYKALRIWITNRDRIDSELTNREWGMDMNQASYWLDYASFGYCFFVALIIAGTLMIVFQSQDDAFLFIPFMTIWIGWLIYVSCTVKRKNRYLIYFRLFDRMDIRWHEKWRYLTYVYTLGGLFAFIGGIFFFITITTS